MRIFHWVLVVFFFINPLHCFSLEKKLPTIDQKIANVAKRFHCQVGVTAIHIETNKKVAFNGNKPFFMASTVKVPIAITLLKRVDEKKDHLDRLVKFNQNSYVPGGKLANDLSQHCGSMTVSLRELMRLMLVISDNTATDLILHELKGPRTVAEHIQSLGFNHIFIHRSILDLYLSASGLNPNANRDKSVLIRKLDTVTPSMKVKAWKRFEGQKSDSATSDDMARLLVALYKGKLMSKSNTQLLLTMMSQCHTGNHRIKGLLPRCVCVAHKTGTWALSNSKFLRYQGSKQLYRFANDIGIITLPCDRGHIAIAFFVKSQAVGEQGRDRVIALITKDIYDYFLQAG